MCKLWDRKVHLVAPGRFLCYNWRRKAEIFMRYDCHMHMLLDGAYWKSAIDRHRESPDRAWIRQQLEKYRAAGFSYLRDGGDRWGASSAAREMAEEFGICYKTPLSPLSRRGHYGGFIGEQYGDIKEYILLVNKMRRQGADFIKIMISGLMDFDHCGVLSEPGLPREEIRELIHIAHEEGFSVMAHANGADTVIAAAEAGVDSVEHGAYLNAQALAAMQEAGTVWVPTISTVGNLLGTGRFDEREVEKILAGLLENVAEFYRMGGLLAPGTDAGAFSVGHGTMSEYGWLEKALGGQELPMEGIVRIIEKF